MSRSMNKAERVREMERLYVQGAYSDIDLAERLGVDRTTVWRDRIEVGREYPMVQDDLGRWRIDRTRYVSAIKLDLHEALTLYLAARRASRQTRTAQPHAASALEKLAVALKQPMTERLVKAAGAILEQQALPERVKVLEDITRAWVEQRALELTYRGLRARQARLHTIHPYLIEPSLWGDGIYVIGFCETHKRLENFKAERVEATYVRLANFEIPETFDEAELLRHAWGIWYGEGQPTTVRLRFQPGQATRRVQESIWHPNQKPLEMLPDGGCIWEAQVAEWQEMLPWVRGWGADVEALAPEELRETLMGEAKAMAEMYGWHVYSKPAGQASSTLNDFFGG